jgi:ribosomal protein S27E
MADFVTLSCPSCGGKLQITKDVERFACAHCGREHIVKRSGGIVSLSPVVDELKKVGVGVDKTASELAIVRLKDEIAYLQRERSLFLQQHPRPNDIGKFLLFSLLVIGILSFLQMPAYFLYQNVTGWSSIPNDSVTFFMALACFSSPFIMGVGGLGLFFSLNYLKHWNETFSVELKSLDEKIIAKYEELKRHQGVVSI